MKTPVYDDINESCRESPAVYSSVTAIMKDRNDKYFFFIFDP